MMGHPMMDNRDWGNLIGVIFWAFILGALIGLLLVH